VRIFGIVEICELKEHEKINKEYLKRLKQEIKLDKILKDPIIVDRNTKIILDGHHRFNGLKELGYKKILVYFVNYKSPEIRVQSRRKEIKVTKDRVIEVALSGKKFPVKTSKHLIPNRPRNICISLEKLK
jgi:ParB-like chromosome segregation protein Spo0J